MTGKINYSPDFQSSGHDMDDARRRFNLPQVYSQSDVDKLLKEQMEKFCRAMCDYCRGIPLVGRTAFVMERDSKKWRHLSGTGSGRECQASPIREKYEEK